MYFNLYIAKYISIPQIYLEPSSLQNANCELVWLQEQLNPPELWPYHDTDVPIKIV